MWEFEALLKLLPLVAKYTSGVIVIVIINNNENTLLLSSLAKELHSDFVAA